MEAWPESLSWPLLLQVRGVNEVLINVDVQRGNSFGFRKVKLKIQVLNVFNVFRFYNNLDIIFRNYGVNVSHTHTHHVLVLFIEILTPRTILGDRPWEVSNSWCGPRKLARTQWEGAVYDINKEGTLLRCLPIPSSSAFYPSELRETQVCCWYITQWASVPADQDKEWENSCLGQRRSRQEPSWEQGQNKRALGPREPLLASLFYNFNMSSSRVPFCRTKKQSGGLHMWENFFFH